MGNPLFNALNGLNGMRMPQQQRPNLFQAFQQFRQNPGQYLSNAGLNIPQEMMNNPNAILNHLLSSGQVSNQKYQAVQQMAQQMASGM